MKRLLKLLPVLAVIAAFGIGGVSSASAGNCTSVYANGPVNVDSGYGYYYPSFTGVVGNCSGVSNVQYGLASGINSGGNAYVWGNGNQPKAYAFAYWSGHPYDPLANSGIEDPTYSTDGYTWVYFGTHYNCNFSTTWWGSFNYRIQSIDIHGVRTWGPWHNVTGNPTPVQASC